MDNAWIIRVPIIMQEENQLDLLGWDDELKVGRRKLHPFLRPRHSVAAYNLCTINGKLTKISRNALDVYRRRPAEVLIWPPT